LSLTAHRAIACFLGAAHMIMLRELQQAKHENNFIVDELLAHWHSLMENGAGEGRKRIMEDVVEFAHEGSLHFITSYLCAYHFF